MDRSTCLLLLGGLVLVLFILCISCKSPRESYKEHHGSGGGHGGSHGGSGHHGGGMHGGGRGRGWGGRGRRWGSGWGGWSGSYGWGWPYYDDWWYQPIYYVDSINPASYSDCGCIMAYKSSIDAGLSKDEAVKVLTSCAHKCM